MTKVSAGPMPPLALWGGVEATVNRIGGLWLDQLRESGHHDRPDDLDQFADHGISALRQPILWERTEHACGVLDWSWPDLWMARMAQRGLRPIVGLLHHGSGPAWTGLAEADFAPGLAAYAEAVARRYPWVEDWTPVNEPLTTARFSGLYGHWYPHHRDETAFWTLLLNQVDATRLSMRAIRRIIPHARLVQTEDFGQTYATPSCQPQADHDNIRRFASWDLLCGMVVRGHPLHRHLCDMGFHRRLEAIAADPCPPDVIGLNHYVTSDRFLDHRLARYPAHMHGGNGRIAYADVEAVRVIDGEDTWARHLDTLWSRYRRPIAITECHLGCDCPDEQVRWFAECWSEALAARQRGVEVLAVTAWALVGSTGWNALLTAPGGLRERGAFEPTAGGLEPMPLAGLLRAVASGAYPAAAAIPGWWRRPERFLFGAADHGSPVEARAQNRAALVAH
ncbi:glycoside hydrolase family 1 protein [Methylobrevis albus]|uniref:Family 1 glycosylhydrolase n=1 Tax=Methylobrevis albus TaxID=2793297 RepID=A0A931I435_9HYPH|nr:family 1 glycosylhydrolase [Methylobrevis albus]MBH0238521.1 family 1 glycosylhydrolase [Methylobrevis albus]